MRFSTAISLVALSSLGLLGSFPNSYGSTFVSATLTAEERLEVEAKDPTNPNYCPACLTKAMNNHFPHACSRDHEPLLATTRPEGPLPHEQRCICIAFMDLSWMKKDCWQECAFVHDAEAMHNFLPADNIPGCDQWVDFESKEEREVEAFEKRNLDHQPVLYPMNQTDDQQEELEDEGEQTEKVVVEVGGEGTEEQEEQEVEAKDGTDNTNPVETKAPEASSENHTKDEL